jgi:hypothetical protein
MASLRALYKPGISRLRQRIATRAILALPDFDEHAAACAHPPWLGPDRPLIARLHPAAAQRSAVRRKPKRRSRQGMHQASLESDDIFEAANAEPDNMLSWQKRRPNEKIHTALATGLARVRTQPRIEDACPSTFPDWIRRREEPHILPSSILNPRMRPLSFVPPRRRICKRSRYMSHGRSSFFSLTWPCLHLQLQGARTKQGILSADSSQPVFTDCSLTPLQRAC